MEKNKTSLFSKSRNSGPELLRIIAMLMIISVHYLDAGGGGIVSRPFTMNFNNAFARGAESVAIIGVNLFVLITGYFSVKQKGINLRRITGIVLLVAFWGGLLYIHGLAAGETFSFVGLIKALFPYMFGTMWYIRVYLMLVILAPFLNILLNRLNSKGLITYIAAITVLFSLLSSFVPAFKNAAGYDIIHFIMMYSIGAAVNLKSDRLPSKSLCFIIFLISSAATTAFSVWGDGLPYWGYDFITCVVSSAALFALFIQIEFHSGIINFIAKTTLGIYVLNISFPYLYTRFIIREQYFDSRYLIVHFAASVIGFFVVACVLETARTLLFSVTVDKVLDKIKFINKRYLQNIEKE